jgi:hypothetical protein
MVAKELLEVAQVRWEEINKYVQERTFTPSSHRYELNNYLGGATEILNAMKEYYAKSNDAQDST